MKYVSLHRYIILSSKESLEDRLWHLEKIPRNLSPISSLCNILEKNNLLKESTDFVNTLILNLCRVG